MRTKATCSAVDAASGVSAPDRRSGSRGVQGASGSRCSTTRSGKANTGGTWASRGHCLAQVLAATVHVGKFPRGFAKSRAVLAGRHFLRWCAGGWYRAKSAVVLPATRASRRGVDDGCHKYPFTGIARSQEPVRAARRSRQGRSRSRRSLGTRNRRHGLPPLVHDRCDRRWPWRRVVAWTTGCMWRCLYHNPDTWAMTNRIPVTVTRAADELRKYRHGLKAMSGG